VFGKGLLEFGTILFFRVRVEEVCVPEEMTMTLQNAMRQQQQQQQQQQGLTMFARDPVKLDPTEHFAHVLTPPSDSMFTGVVDACGESPIDTRKLSSDFWNPTLGVFFSCFLIKKPY
jgi:hypothetical protein